MSNGDPLRAALHYPLIDALRERRSRRFVRGMRSDVGPLAYQSRQPAVPLTEDEEALLAFAACGITGHALCDLVYAPGEGGAMMAGLAGRTVASGDAIHTVSVFVINDQGTFLLERPQDLTPHEISERIAQARDGAFTDLYRRCRVRIADRRIAPPTEPIYNLNINRWSLYEPGCTYFLPVNELTHMYINGVLEIFNETTGAFVLDERAGFRPAGIARFGRSRGGHLYDDPRDQRVSTIQQVETLVTELVTIEQGMVLQNLALMTQALGIGGFPHWAAHPFGWLEALGFQMRTVPASRYLGMGKLVSTVARLLGKDTRVPLATGLEHDGRALLTPFCPPNYPSMEAAVRAVVDRKFGAQGVFRGGTKYSAWRDPQTIAEAAPAPSEANVDATIAYCEYVHRRYGRFPAYPPPFRTVLGYQVGHVDTDFYDRFYRPESLSDTQREHMRHWHPEELRPSQDVASPPGAGAGNGR